AGAAPGQQQVTRTRLLKFDLATGVLDPIWTPSINGRGTSITASDDGSIIYVSGYFTSPRSRIAAFDAATGALVSSFNPTTTNSHVLGIDVSGNTLYAGG